MINKMTILIREIAKSSLIQKINVSFWEYMMPDVESLFILGKSQAIARGY